MEKPVPASFFMLSFKERLYATFSASESRKSTQAEKLVKVKDVMSRVVKMMENIK